MSTLAASVNEQWQTYRTRCLGSAPKEKVAACHDAFIAGAYAATNPEEALDAPVSTDEAIGALDDVIVGADAIGVVLGLTRQQVYYRNRRGQLPLRTLGGTFVARRSELLKLGDFLKEGTDG